MLPHKSKTADEAVGRWPAILQSLGVDARYLRNRHGPCPLCQGKDRYRFDDKDGRGTWFCSHCGAGDGFKLLANLFGWAFSHAAKEVDRVCGTVQPGTVTAERTTAEKAQVLRSTWQASRTVIAGDPVALYLKRRCDVDAVPPDLRFHPNLKHPDGGAHPAMLALMRYPDGPAASIHRTYLTDAGEKAAVSTVKMFMQGKSLKTASVQLSTPSGYIAIAEGIETALCAAKRFQLPVWAATNAGLLADWVPPVGIDRVLIAGDNDHSYTGQNAAFTLARRLSAKGIKCEVRIPDVTGNDWADA